MCVMYYELCKMNYAVLDSIRRVTEDCESVFVVARMQRLESKLVGVGIDVVRVAAESVVKEDVIVKKIRAVGVATPRALDVVEAVVEFDYLFFFKRTRPPPKPTLLPAGPLFI